MQLLLKHSSLDCSRRIPRAYEEKNLGFRFGDFFFPCMYDFTFIPMARALGFPRHTLTELTNVLRSFSSRPLRSCCSIKVSKNPWPRSGSESGSKIPKESKRERTSILLVFQKVNILERKIIRVILELAKKIAFLFYFIVLNLFREYGSISFSSFYWESACP